MTKVVVAKFGGSAIGVNGESIPSIIKRIDELQKKSKVVAVFSAPLTISVGNRKSITDVTLSIGEESKNQKDIDIAVIEDTYKEILKFVNTEYQDQCNELIQSFLNEAKVAFEIAYKKQEFVDEIRSKALAYSGEILMAHVMEFILKSQGIKVRALGLDHWPIITDNNIESTNFLALESKQRIQELENLLDGNDVVSIGGFIGKTPDGVLTTYERGGSDRTAADIGILLNKSYDVTIDLEKDSSVVSADPRIVEKELTEVKFLSYNEARLAGMFGMKILDPIAIKEILENGVDLPITITNMHNPEKITTIKRKIGEGNGHPLKIVTGKKNCAILRLESEIAIKLLDSLEKEKRYSEFIVLSPFTKDGIRFTRILFLDADYIKRNEKFVLGFDSLATISYNRGVITMIGDEMWRVQQIASKASSKIGESGLNILNMDAQEETSRIIIVIEDTGDNIQKAICAIHAERSNIKFI